MTIQTKATERYFTVVLFVSLRSNDLTCVTPQMKIIERYFSVVFVSLCIKDLTFE